MSIFKHTTSIKVHQRFKAKCWTIASTFPPFQAWNNSGKIIRISQTQQNQSAIVIQLLVWSTLQLLQNNSAISQRSNKHYDCDVFRPVAIF